MSVSAYFARPSDTAIAARDPAFIESLAWAAVRMRDIRVALRPESADIVLIDERYQYRTWHYADELAQSEFVRRHADRICVINHDDHARPFLPGLYTSLEKSRPTFVPTSAVPYKRDLWLIPAPAPIEIPPTKLFAFRGTFHTHPIRKRMCSALRQSREGTCEELRKSFHSHDEPDQERYIADIRDAHFSLCPRGLSPTTYRLYESMQLGRSPVIISNDWTPPPGPSWDECAVFVKEEEVKRIGSRLYAEVGAATERGRAAAEAWKEFFSWPNRRNYFLKAATELQRNFIDPLGYAELRDLWGSKIFRARYEWTSTGRIRQFFIRKIRGLSQTPPA